MATPSELSLAEIRNYLLEHGGSARNRDLVKYFKAFLTDPDTRVDARNRFKDYVNTLATIKNEEGEKYLVLKKKYRLGLEDASDAPISPCSVTTPDFSALSTPSSPLRDPPPYRPPPPAPLSPSIGSITSLQSPPEELYATVNKPHRGVSGDQAVGNEVYSVNQRQIEERAGEKMRQEANDPVPVSSPPVPPRRKSQDKVKMENKENISDRANDYEVIKEDVASTGVLGTPELPSVRERMQRFNRMASETDLPGRPNGTTTPTKKRSDKGAEEDDRASVASQLDGKSREWLVRAAQGDYQALAKLAVEEPRLTRLKDPSSGYTALHWGAKHGDEDIVKLIAGTYKEHIKDVNATTNGGYTALHIAMQFNHENIFNLLVQVYGANQEIRDYSGKKARQYVPSQEAAVSQDTFRRILAATTHRNKSKEKAHRERSWFPTNWLTERPREAYNGSLQSIPGCGYQW